MFYTPTKHQNEDSEALLDYEHGYLWADAGTGKTVTAMEAFRKGPHEKMVVICPKIALSMWKHELEKHLESKVNPGKKFYARIINSGGYIPTKKHAATGKVTGIPLHSADALIITFDLMKKHQKLIDSFVMGEGVKVPAVFDTRFKTVCVLDEAHYIKSKDAQRTKAFRYLFMSNIFMDVWQLTGTPVMRYYDDLYTQLAYGRQDVLKAWGVDTYDKFVAEFCTMKTVQYGRMARPQRQVAGNKNSAKLDKLLQSCKVIRRKLSDVVADLPPITHRIVTAEYKGVPSTSINMATLMRELNDPDSELAKTRRLLGVAKVPSVAAYAREYGRKPLLIGYWHKDVGAALREELEGAGPLDMVDGSTPQNKRDLIREAFNGGQLAFLLGQMQAMNVSWNLQEMCDHVLIAEEVPSPGLLHQFYSRVYRRGQSRHVQVDYLRSEHDLDIALANIREMKQTDNERANL